MRQNRSNPPASHAVSIGVALVAFMLSACSEDPSTRQEPTAAAIEFQRLLSTEGYGELYSRIHPAIRDIVTEEKFLACAEQNSAGVTPFGFLRLEGILVRNLADTVAVPSRERYVLPDQEPKVVTVRIVQTAGTIDVLWFVGKSDGEWRWFFPSSLMDSYAQGDCTVRLDP